MASKAAESDAGSLTPSEQSEGEERSEHDSDYETDEAEEDIKGSDTSNLVWTGYGKKTPVLIFNADAVLNKRPDLKTIGEKYHLAFKFGTTECKIVRNILSSHGFHEVHPNSSDFNVLWTNAHLKPFTLRGMTEFQKINHFPRSYELTRKDRLFKNVQRMQQMKGQRHFDFIPNSYILPGEYQDFCAAFLREKGHWIVKPVASSRGRGVFLINHPDQIPLDENVIVCRYLSNPLLIDGFKFDVRLYITVTSYDPLIIYLFEEGLTRFATVKYEKSNRHIRNQCMHLTNYSVNKKSQDYVRNDDPNVEDYGNKWSLGALLRYLRSQGKDIAALMMRIEDVIIKTIISVELPIATACKMFMPHRGNCFELYGFDILIDDNLKPWVLEVNLSPSLACDSPLDMKIKSNMLSDLFSMSGIVCHDPMVRNIQQSRRNQEITNKMAARAKKVHKKKSTARARPVASATRQRPQSAGASNSNVNLKDKSNCMSGLNSEEIKVIRRTKEEEIRKGGWVRIFPTMDSWEIYSPFLQFNTSYNLMLHQKLYPDRHKGNFGKAATTGVASVASRSRTSYLQLTGQATGKNEAELQRNVELYTQAMIRTKQYERRLGQKKKRSKNKKKSRFSSGSKSKLAQGLPEEMAEDELPEDETANERPEHNQEEKDEVSNEEKVLSVEEVEVVPAFDTALVEVKVVEKPPVMPVRVKEDEKVVEDVEPDPEPKLNVVELLIKGRTLSKVQARSAFAMYLIRVQQRLINNEGAITQDDVEALNEQMDLVLRFLKRAAVNLQQTFKVIVPSRKLPLSDRRRILAKELGDFVHIYNKETEQIKSRKVIERRQLRRSESVEGLHESQFEKFVIRACEAELEEVLTTYTKLNKSASIFLGSHSRPPSEMVGSKSDNTLQKRRDSCESTEPGDLHRMSSISSADLRYDRGGSSHSLPRPSSAHSPPSSYSNAISIYSQKLSRPRSAVNTNIKTAGTRSPHIRPLSANQAQLSSASTFTTTEPIVDTYNEQAIHDALQRLALRQQARQYAALNGTSALPPDAIIRPQHSESAISTRPHFLGAPLGNRPGSASITRARQDTLYHAAEHSGSMHNLSYTRRPDSVQPLHRYTEEPTVRPRPLSATSSTTTRPTMKPIQTNVNMMNANATFNSFIDDPTTQWQSDLMTAYNQVTGVNPQNYSIASLGSRQYHIAQQQQNLKQQKLMEQSKALLKQSKAKHQAMVAQAHAAQRTLNYVRPAEESQTRQTFLPKPPLQPAVGKRAPPVNRLARAASLTADESSLNFNFYNTLKYDIHTGQTRTQTDGYH